MFAPTSKELLLSNPKGQIQVKTQDWNVVSTLISRLLSDLSNKSSFSSDVALDRWFGQRSTRSQGSVPLTALLNSAGLAWRWRLGLKPSQEMFTGTVTHLHCDHSYKMSQSSSEGGLSVEDGESPGARACGCNITRELEVRMPRTWLLEQVPFGCSWFSNDLQNVTSVTIQYNLLYICVVGFWSQALRSLILGLRSDSLMQNGMAM